VSPIRGGLRMERELPCHASREVLVDNALSSSGRLLKDAGHDAVHVRDYELHAAEDPIILERAGYEDRILVSRLGFRHAPGDFPPHKTVVRAVSRARRDPRRGLR